MSHPAFYLNIFGIRPSDEQMAKIPAPRFELVTHVAMQTSQACGLIGCLTAPVTCWARNEHRDWELVKQRMYQHGRIGMVAGLIIGPVLTAPFLLKSTEYLQTMCYRIRFNENLLLADRFSILGIAIGLGAAKYLGEDLEKGAMFGFIGGFLCATLNHIGIWNPVNLAEKMNLI